MGGSELERRECPAAQGVAPSNSSVGQRQPDTSSASPPGCKKRKKCQGCAQFKLSGMSPAVHKNEPIPMRKMAKKTNRSGRL
jgi:hypothetical protein